MNTLDQDFVLYRLIERVIYAAGVLAATCRSTGVIKTSRTVVLYNTFNREMSR